MFRIKLNFPTLSLGYRIAQYSPTISLPPPEHPAIKAKPVPSPLMAPPIRQVVRQSFISGREGEGIITIKKDCRNTVKIVLARKFLLMILETRKNKGIFNTHKMIPDTSI